MLGRIARRIGVGLPLLFGGLVVLGNEGLLKKDDSYAQARTHLVKLGWLPVITHKAMADGTEEREWGDAKQMKDAGFDEVESCSGTGPSYCFFNFKKRNACLRVTTAGVLKKEHGSPRVHAWSVGPCGKAAR